MIPEVTEWPYAEPAPVPDGYRVHKQIKDLTLVRKRLKKAA